MSDVLVLDAVGKVYAADGPAPVTVLDGASLALAAGEIVALVAPSGAGKSTLLHIAGLLDTPTSGAIRLAGADTGGLDDRARTRIRRDTVGFIYQFHHLLPEFSALENVTLPQRAAGVPLDAARPGRGTSSPKSASPTASTTAPRSSRAANSSASPSPARSPTRRSCFWLTSRPAISTPRPRITSSAC